MSRGFTVLVADKNAKDARLVGDALAALALPYPVHVASGKEAVAWVGMHECDVCVVDYGLSDLNGLETLIRIHQRKPALPVILTSRAQSEEVAVSAFHAGVVDYVPKKRGYQDHVADVIHKIEQQLLQDRARGRPDGTAQRAIDPAPPPVPLVSARAGNAGAILEPLLQPTYQNRLRAIGHELDGYAYRSINLSQVVDGFHVRAIAPRQRTPEVLVFGDRDLQVLIERSFERRGTGERVSVHPKWLPTGYEDFLRALGYELDQRKAEAITITEFDTMVAVGGVALLDHDSVAGLGPFQDFWNHQDISNLLDTAFRRRASPQRGGIAGLLRR